jgi:bifunctional non-homologous end joining protein LigD
MSETQVQVDARALDAKTVAASAPAAIGMSAAEYYRQIAPTLLPHLRGRSVVLKACANGTQEGAQGESRGAAVLPIPPSLATHRLAYGDREPVECCVIPNPSALQCVGMLGAELHVLPARDEADARPAAIVFQLEPTPPAGMLECVGIALDLRDMFGEVGLRCWAKTCGGQGLHLCVPLNTPATFSQVRAFARMVAETYVNRYPDMATTSARKQVYPGQVFIDWQANQEEQPSLCVYSLCSNGRQTTVSTPVTWREIKAVWMRQEESPLVFGPDQVIERVASKGDLFEQVLAVQQRLPV